MDDSVNAYRAQFISDKLMEYSFQDQWDWSIPEAEIIFKWLQEFEESHV